MAREPEGRTAAGGIFPRRFYRPRADRPNRLLQQGDGLQHPVPRHRRNSAHHCRRPETSGCRNRLLRRASYLGTKPPASPASALRHPRRRLVFRSRTLDRMHARLLPSLTTGATAPVNYLSEDKAWPFLRAHGQSSPACSGGSFSKNWKTLSTSDNSSFPVPSSRSRTPSPLRHCCARWETAIGLFTRNRLSVVRNRRSNTSAAIRTASPYPISGCSQTKTAKSLSSGRITSMKTDRTQKS
jgi:hypothetical protein